MIHYLVPGSQAFGMAEYLELHGAALADVVKVLHYEDVARSGHVPMGTVILSGLDMVHPRMLEALSALEQSESARKTVRLVNSPSGTLTRLPLLVEYNRRGVNPFRAVQGDQAVEAGLRFPVFVRHQYDHGGAQTALIRDSRELAEALGRFAAKGWTSDQLLVEEFCDTVDSAGVYRKYAAFVVGDRVIARSLAVGRHWMLKHSSGEYTEATLEEESRYVEVNPHAAVLGELAKIADVGWGRFDYALLDGRPVVWEINLNPTIGRGRRPGSGVIPEHLRHLRDAARRVFYERFESALRAVDSASDGGRVELNTKDIVQVLRQRGPDPRGPWWLRVSRPLRPILEPLIRPLLVRLGRQR
ncbi:MAG: hypothetical protein ACT4OZ_01260 [Gemmatimonadota bacterium]